MTDWSDVEFCAASLKPRKSKDFLSAVVAVLVIWDVLACALAGVAALFLYRRFMSSEFYDLEELAPFHRDIAFGSVIAALLMHTSGNSIDPRSSSISGLIWSAERKSLVTFSILIAIGLMTRATDDLARLWIILWMLVFAAATACSRYAVGMYLHRLQNHGEFREAVAIIGATGVRERMASRISEEADIVGLFTAASANDDLDEDHEDELKQLFDLGREGGLDAIVLALDTNTQGDVQHTIDRLKELPVQVAIFPSKNWIQEGTSQMRMLGGMPMAVVSDRPINQIDLLIKTALDKLGALFLLVVLAPIMLVIAATVATTSPGPVIFRQMRRGWCGSTFVIFKFRTMYDAEGPGKTQTARNDPRCTPVGRFLRSSSLDELPQLWNVLRGEMSLVGPRPHADALYEFDRAGHEIVSEYAQRHRVKPGLTGWAQVSGARGATASLVQLRHRVELDLYYIENWSLLLDLKILLRTPLVMVGDRVF